MSYWGYRIDKSKIDFFWNELGEGRLRQGWGWLEGQNLRNLTIDQGAKRNLPMLKVKKGDILLVPFNYWDFVAIVEATEDWETGYKFEIDKTTGDFGHIFPVKYRTRFSRGNEHVTGNIRATLKNPLRFWNVNSYGNDIDKLLSIEQTELEKKQDHEARFKNSIEIVFKDVFDEDKFPEKLHEKMLEQFSNEEWEFALAYGLRQLFPSYSIERVGGGNREAEHGTDILITIPGIIPGTAYRIAIQVKDYEGIVRQNVIEQVKKADDYYKDENIPLIEKIVIVTKASEDENIDLENKGKECGVKFIFAKDLKDLLSKIGLRFMSKKF